MEEFKKLIEVVKKLRDPKDGCPWDLQQTHSSLLKYLIEESYEFSHSVEEKDNNKMEEELGDILLQVLLHSQIANENKVFNLESVSKRLKEKLIRRHPHVFGGEKVQNAKEVSENWENIKNKEQKESASLIGDDILKCPSLFSAYKIGQKTNKVNFDWDDHNQVMYKVEEEWQELKEELVHDPSANKKRISEEIGDFLFSTAQLARHLDIEPETCLRLANQKFIKRFRKMEELILKENKKIEMMNQQEMDIYWNRIKKE